MHVVKEKYRCEIELTESGNYSATVHGPKGALAVIVKETRQEAIDAAKQWVRWHRDRPEPEVFEL